MPTDRRAATISCRLLRCGRQQDPHFLPWTFDDPLPTCPFDGTPTTVDEADTWCVRHVWEEVMELFGREVQE